MDEKTLKKILSQDHAPAIDENARKRALNLAMSEFKTAQSEKNQKTSQGISFLSRLMGKTNNERGVHTMERKTRKKLWQGTAMLTCALALFALPVAMESMYETTGSGVGARTAKLKAVQFTTNQGDNNFSSIASNVNTSVSSLPGLSGLGEMFAKDKANDPVPAETPETRIEIAQADAEPLSEWKRQSADKAAVRDEGDALQATPETSKTFKNLQYGGLKEKKTEVQRTKPSSPKDNVASGMAYEQELMPSMPASPIAKGDVVEKPLDDWRRSPEEMVVQQSASNDKFADFTPNPFKQVSAEPVSTFSSDVDTASYSFVRKTINNGRLPNPAAVRVEEMVNYFDYDYAVPNTRAKPFKPTVTITDSPWAKGRKLMHIGVKGYDVEKKELRSNVVFLLDVSGSMNQRDKLPLVKSSMKMLLDSLHPDDTVSIVTYAGSTGIVLEPTKASNRNTIIRAMNDLRAGGGTAGAAGIELAYNMAERNFDKRAVNRVILATDGDFNVGITDRNELKRYIERKRDKGIFLSVLGFGQGNYNDQLMQTLAQNGNGIAAYIDNLNEAQKVLVQQATSSLFPIAKDVKFQVEFNPSTVAEYRLIGYETRALKREDFNNDKIDAGDIGAGHSVTAIYEFVPVGSDARTVDELRYGQSKKAAPVKPVMDDNGEYAFLKIRYKLPMENTSKLITTPVLQNGEYKRNLTDTRFATAVAAFGQILKGGEHTGTFDYDDVIELAQSGRGNDKYGYRAEFIKMVRLAKSLSR